jgi:hypothetical protein
MVFVNFKTWQLENPKKSFFSPFKKKLQACKISPKKA